MSSEHELDALFRAERAVSPAADAEARVWQRLSSDLAANVAPLPVGAGALKLNAWLVPKWLLLGLALGLAGVGASASVSGVWAPSGERASRFPSAPLVASALHPRLAASEPAASRAPAVPSASGHRYVEHRVAAALPAAEAIGAGTFDAELKLITLAKGELDAHHPRQAQAWLDEHAQQFPKGVFAVEREALGILSRCEQGPKDEVAAREFGKRHPGSPLIQRIQRVCQPATDSSNSLNGAASPGAPMARPSGGSTP